jgi:hypothetical protein
VGWLIGGNNVYAASTGPGRYGSGHVYLSNGGTSPWVAVGSNNFAKATRVHSLAVGNNGSVYAGVNSLLNGAVAGGNVYVAATPTSIWQLVGGGAMPNNKFVIALTTDVNNNVYAGTSSINQSGGIVYISNNGSGVWTQFATPMPDGGTINKIIVDSQKDIYTASGGGNVYVATNGSASWNIVGGGSPDNTPVYSIYVSTSGDVYAATKNGMVYFSSGGTGSWVLIAGGRVPL